MDAGIRFKETMDGYFGTKLRSFKDGEDYGIRDDNTIHIIDPNNTLGEGEISDINNLTEPTMYYNYICGISPLIDKIFLKIDSGVLRNERTLYFKDLFDKALGKIYERNIKKNVILGDSIEDNPSQPQVIKDDIFSLLNDHYPTATL